ncbi:MAG: DUF4116 domain-containing protein [Candidatus Rhabdochlamydia sp.]
MRLQEYGMALEYASEDLKRDQEVVYTAINQNPEALQFADKDVVLAFLQQEARLLIYASAVLRDDKDVVLVAVQKRGEVLEFASKALRGNKTIVLAAIKQNRSAREYASEDLKQDREILLAAGLLR